MEAKHTKCKLHFDGQQIITATELMLDSQEVAVPTGSNFMEDGKRLAACWNACADIPDPSVVGELVEACKVAADLYCTDPDTVESEDRLIKDTEQAIDDLMVTFAALSKATP